MIRHGHSFQEEHEVDVPVAGSLYIPAGEDPVHGSVTHDLEQCPGLCLIFTDPVISGIQFRKIHFLHKCIKQAYRVICRDHGIHFEWKFELIIVQNFSIIRL